MDAVAQAPTTSVGLLARARDRDGPHDLADLTLAAEQVATVGHPATDADRLAVELEGPRVDHGALRPADRSLGGDDVEQIDPPGRAIDDQTTASASLRDVVADDRPDLDAHDLHRE